MSAEGLILKTGEDGEGTYTEINGNTYKVTKYANIEKVYQVGRQDMTNWLCISVLLKSDYCRMPPTLRRVMV